MLLHSFTRIGAKSRQMRDKRLIGYEQRHNSPQETLQERHRNGSEKAQKQF